MQTIGLELAESLDPLLRLLLRGASAGQLSIPTAATLSRLIHHGPQRLTELATAEGVSQPGMTQLVSRLEQGGFARRCADDGDARVVLVEATDAGRALAQRRRQERAAILNDLVAELDDADQQAISAAVPALTRLAARVDRRVATHPDRPSGAAS